MLALAQDILLEDAAPQGAVGGPLPVRRGAAADRGQGADLAFEQRDDVTLAECLTMAGDKTAALMACACSIGADARGRAARAGHGLAGFGAHAGWPSSSPTTCSASGARPEVTGKPVRADLRARKKSLPVVAALSSGTPEAGELAALLARRAEALTEDDLVRAADLVVAAGGKDWAESEADAQLAAANACLADIDMPGDVRAELTAIAEFITARVAVTRRVRGAALRDRSGPGRPPQEALDRARDHLLGLQHAEGWWQGELETNVTMDAEDLLLREFLGLHDDAVITAAGRWIGPSSETTAPGPTSTAGPPTCPPRWRPTWRCGWPATSRTRRT